MTLEAITRQGFAREMGLPVDGGEVVGVEAYRAVVHR